MAIITNRGPVVARTSGHRTYRPISEINVTPMVDVMLVLLVVFMITAPLLTVGVPVDLPKTKSARIIGEDEPLVITVNSKGSIFLQDTEIALAKLVPRLKAITANKKGSRIFIRGDRSIAYGRVMEVMDRINRAGFSKVALITELPKSGDRKRKKKKNRRSGR